MNFNHLFIVTYGRSGSTLLQGILNSIPGVIVRGENAGALHGLVQSWQAAKVAQELFSSESEKSTSSWYGAASIGLDDYGRDLATSFIRNVLKPPPDARVIGFKEIRYHMTADELVFELEFMRRFFPRSAFLINTRDLAATINSNKKAGHGVSVDELISADHLFREITKSPSGDVFHVHYDDYCNNPARLNPLFDFLGAHFDQDVVQKVLDVRHSG